MYTSTPTFSRQSFRDRYKRHRAARQIEAPDERLSLVRPRLHTVKLRRRRAQATRSFYDNAEDDEDEHITSKWTIVRQRLPDILALSNTYKPISVRAQLVLLVALMNKQSDGQLNEINQLNTNEYNNTISQIVPNKAILDSGGRRRLIYLKRIPSEQMIHVDVDSLSFSVPTRQFILAISHGYARETAARYCPPAITDMLIDLSQRKIISDRLQYKRAKFKMRLGQILFFIIFIFIITMMFTLIIGATNTIFYNRFSQSNNTTNTNTSSTIMEKQWISPVQTGKDSDDQ